jgi:hypothetical protein
LLGSSSSPRFDFVGLSTGSTWVGAAAEVSAASGAGSSSLSAEVEAVTSATELGGAGYIVSLCDTAMLADTYCWFRLLLSLCLGRLSGSCRLGRSCRRKFL